MSCYFKEEELKDALKKEINAIRKENKNIEVLPLDNKIAIILIQEDGKDDRVVGLACDYKNKMVQTETKIVRGHKVRWIGAKIFGGIGYTGEDNMQVHVIVYVGCADHFRRDISIWFNTSSQKYTEASLSW